MRPSHTLCAILAVVSFAPCLCSQTSDAFDPGANATVWALARQPDGKILVGGDFTSLGGQTRNRLGRLNPDGSLDAAFIGGTNFNNSSTWGANGTVTCFAVQPDGKILLGGSFTTVAGQTRNRITRLNADGSLDTNFVSAGASGVINALVLQTNGQIVVGGNFTLLGGQSHSSIGRLNADGSLDTNFTPVAVGTVNALALQSDGRIVVGGNFSSLSEQGKPNLDRLNSDGTADPGFLSTGASAPVYALAIQADGQIVAGGTFTTLNGTSSARLGRLYADGSLDNGFVAAVSVSGTVYSLALQTDGAVLAGGSFATVNGASRTNLVRVNGNGTLDTGFCAGATHPLSPSVRALLVMPDSRILVGGSFTMLAGQAHNYIGRLNADGSGEFSFNPNPNGKIYALATQADGKLLVGGDFTTIAGQSRKGIARFNADGTLDMGFNPGVSGSHGLGSGGNTVYCLAVQTNGQILVGGWFTNLAGGYRLSIGRINADGSLDTSFNPTTGGYYPYVYCLVVQTNGQILVGGTFSSFCGQGRTGLGRVSQSGALDTSFNPYLVDIYGGTGRIMSLIAQPDAKILVGGLFNTVNGQSRNNLLRLLSNGSIDSTFTVTNTGGYGNGVNCLALQTNNLVLVGGNLPGQQVARLNTDGTQDTNFNAVANGNINAILLQADGGILMGGEFTTLNGQTNISLGRLNANGTSDTSFSAGIQASYPAVYSLALRSDGGIFVSGSFPSLGGQTRTNLGRLNNTTPATQNLAFNGSTITWLRGGTSPEAGRTVFEASTNGNDRVFLGAGVRTNGGWRVTGLSLPPNATIRARALVQSGQRNGSAGLMETAIGKPLVTTQPAGRTNNAGTPASFSITAIGSEPFWYQWLKNGVPVSDGLGVSGAGSPSLALSNVFGSDAAGYSVNVTNSSGSITSQVAILVVRDPFIGTQPVNVAVLPGQAATLSATAFGTTPIACQWRRNGTNQPGATGQELSFTSAQPLDAGVFDLVASNAFGVVTSVTAVLSVQWPNPDGLNPGANSTVWTMIPQADGKILAGGHFSVIGGQGYPCFARLNADGVVDTNFNAAANWDVHAMEELPNGQVLVGGLFSALAGQACAALGRVNPDGTLDTNFVSGITGNSPQVNAIAVQPDGKILVGGWFDALGGLPCGHFGRIYADCTLDTNFLGGANTWVDGLALQADGKVLVWGFFSALAGQPCDYLGRVNADGTLDPGFNPSPNDEVSAAVVLPDGRILAGGNFTSLGGQPCNSFGCLNTDGSLDTNFNPRANGWVGTIAVQADGKIIIGGGFSQLGGVPRNRIGRLYADGSLDPVFDPGADNYVNSLALQGDGGILVSGQFGSLGGSGRSRLGRLTNTDPALQVLTFDSFAARWRRSGTGPEISRATFESSTNGVDWVSLGEGTRTADGWQVTGVCAATNATLRARGFARGGQNNGSGWFEEGSLAVDPRTPPRILADDGKLGFGTNGFGFSLSALSGQTVIVDASADLATWVPLVTNAVSASPFYVSDPAATNSAVMFYRARLP